MSNERCLSKSVNCELWADKGRCIIVYLGPGTEGITFVASTFAVISLLTALNAVSKK